MVQRVLVTGATGFLGSHILEALQPLAERGEISLVAACRDHSKLLPSFTGETREGDLRDANYLKSLLEDIDIVCNAASWTSLWGKSKESHELFLRPGLALTDAAKAAGVKRFINTSTTSVAAPQLSANANTPGIKRSFWPHMCNVITIEDHLRDIASEHFQVINLRLGIFAGSRYALGILPILLPRLKTHLVPWVKGGSTHLPLVDGRDLGQSFAKAVVVSKLPNSYEGFNIIGPSHPTLRQVITFLSEEYGYPKPHFSVPFAIAYPFAWMMEKIDPIVPWDPLITRSIVHLIEDTHTDNDKAGTLLGYYPIHHWQDTIRIQVQEMQQRQLTPMPMYRPLPE